MTIVTTSILDTTMQGLEAGLQIGQIATRDLLTCDVDQTVGEVRADPANDGIDFLPVLDGGRIVGVLEVSEPSDAVVGKAKQSMSDSMLVSASMSIGDFVRQLDTRDYWLVVEGNSIAGIVTRSDVLKLPVRVFAFALVTHLEMLMARLITSRMSDDEWLACLKDHRRERVFAKRKDLKNYKLDPPLIELTEFADKVFLARRLMGYSERFENDLGSVGRRLRDTIAHAGDYAPDDASLSKFVDLVKKTEEWITVISGELHDGEARSDAA